MQGRAATLECFKLLDLNSEQEYDDIALIAQTICQTQTALINLITDDHALFKAHVGLDLPEGRKVAVPVEDTVCVLTVEAGEMLVIPDLSKDPRTAELAYIATPPHYRFYAGAPLVGKSGFVFGTLCVADFEARDGLTEVQHRSLLSLARQVSMLIDSRRTNQRQEVLRRELAHRGKNLFSLIQAVATQTLHHAPDLKTAQTLMLGRFSALNRANDILVNGVDQSTCIETLVQDVKQALDLHDRIRSTGGALMLPSKAALSLSLILHELATNAMKYGALSNEEGSVSIFWQCGETLSLEWVEAGGPPIVAPPRHRGFGTRLLQMGLPQSGSYGRFEYDPTGLRYRVEAPLNH